MEKGVVTFSFDDGRKDTYHVFKDILKPRDLSAVVYIPTGYIDIGFDDPKEIGLNGLMTRQELDEVQADPLFEVAAHGWMHKNDFADLEKGLVLLREWYPEQKEFGLASPHSEITRTYVDEREEAFKKIGFQYVRGGRNFTKNTAVKRAVSLAARLTKSPWLFCYCYKCSVNKEPSYYLNAVAIHRETTLAQLKAIVDYCAKNKCWAILEFHGIDKRGSKEYGEIFCWAEEDFIALCDYITQLRAEGKLDVMTPIEACKIGQ